MNSANPFSDPPTKAGTQARLVYWQRITVAVLFLSLTAAVWSAQSEKNRADTWHAEALRLQNQRVGEPVMSAPEAASDVPMPVQAPGPTALRSAYYPLTLIAEDGSKTPLAGKALQIDLGAGRQLEVLLNRQQQGRLYLWAPAKRDDDHFHRVVFYPSCANAFGLELSRVELSGEATDAVAYKAPR